MLKVWGAGRGRGGPPLKVVNRVAIEKQKQRRQRRGEAPFASHKMYTDVLDDAVKEQRELGMSLGFVWRRSARRTVVYEDCGVSVGMQEGIDDATAIGQEIERRCIGWREEGQ